MFEDGIYTVTNKLEDIVTVETDSLSINEHQWFTVSQNQLNVAEAELRAAKADNLPKLNLQGGLQKLMVIQVLYLSKGISFHSCQVQTKPELNRQN